MIGARRVEATSAMHTHYGGLLRFLFPLIFGPIRYPRKDAEAIRALAADGIVVYVARAKSTALVLYFNYALTRLKLPLARFVGGVNLLLWQPVGRLYRLVLQRRAPEQDDWARGFSERPPTRSESVLAGVTRDGHASFLVLQQSRMQKSRLSNDYVRTLIAVQRHQKRPIYLVPHVLTTRGMGAGTVAGTPKNLRKGREARFRHLRALLTDARNAAVRVADPLNLLDVIDRTPDADDAQLARHVRHELQRRMEEEERVVAGPQLPAFESVARHVLRSQRLRNTIGEEAEQSDAGKAELERRARRYLREIAARYSPNVIGVLSRILEWAFTKIYDGIAVDEKGLARALSAARHGPLVFCPSHRSHVDYLLLSHILWEKGVAPPHIAAGANLSFFPLGTVFRRGGAFFLRRSFGTNRIYSSVFRAYIAELLRSGASIEFFPEGTRSRTGKVLMPRYGILAMVIEAWRREARDEIQFVPVSIDYERIVEARSYERELLGDAKKGEDVRGLLGTRKVLRSRYGRVHVQFGSPISLKALATSRGLPRADDAEAEEIWRPEIQKLGFRIMHEIASCCTITPTSIVAVALLGHGGRGISRSRLIERCRETVEFLDAAAARVSAALSSPQRLAPLVIEATQRLVDDAWVVVDRPGRTDIEPIYRVPDDRRVLLDYHKNAIMNHFAPSAIVARSLLHHSPDDRRYEAIARDTQFLSRLFKHEFFYRADSTFQTYFDDAVAALAARGFLDAGEDDTLTVREEEPLRLLSGLLDAFVQTYWITVQTARALREFPLWEKELAERALDAARRAYLEGSITRPEAASRTRVDTAIAWMRSRGMLVAAKPGGKRQNLSLSDEYQGEALEALIADIERLL